MSGLIHLLDDCLLPLLAVTTVLLAIGCGLMGLMRSPAHRQRTGELTLAAIFGWWVLACLPLPRLVPERLWTWPNLRVRSVATMQEFTPDLTGRAHTSLRGEPELNGPLSSDEALLETARLDRPGGDSAATAIADAFAADVARSAIARPQDPPQHDRAANPPAVTGPSWLATVYLTGAAGSLLWLACGHIRLRRLRRTARRPPAWLSEMFAELAEEAGQRPILLVSRHSTRPMSWGTWRPTIVLPRSLVRRRHREQLRMVLLHELAHVVRHDSRGNGLLCLALPLLYPHPLFLWLRAQVRMAAELLADDWAARRAGKLDYVEQLVVLARSSARSPGLLPLAGAVTLYSSSSQFYRRMQMLISRTCPLSVAPTTRWRLSSLAVAVLAAATAASLAGARPASGQQPSSGDAVTPPELPAKAPLPPPLADPNAATKPGLDQLPGVGRLFVKADGATPDGGSSADEQALRARLAAAEDRIRVLEAQLKLFGANPVAATPASGKTTAQQSNNVTLTRVTEDGSIAYETWTTGADGRPDKLVSRKVGRHDESPIASSRTTVSQDGRVVKQFKGKDGTLTTQVYDSNTGKLIESTTVAYPAATKSADGAEQPKTPTSTSVPTFNRSSGGPGGQPIGFSQDPTSSANGSAETAGLDLVKLATAYADALGALEEAETRLAAGGPENELALAKAAVRNARRKQELLRNLASVAAEAARADLGRTQQLVDKGFATAGAATTAESRLKMLNAILQSGSTGEVESKPAGRSPAAP